MTTWSAAEVAAILQLEPLPHEGGWFRRTYADANVSTILYLVAAGDGFSAMHRLDGPEIYTFAAGDPAELLLLDAGGSDAGGRDAGGDAGGDDGGGDDGGDVGGDGAHVVRLGADLAAGELPQVVVDGATWQGCITLGAWTLLSATMAPPYTDERFELGDRAALVARWPAATAAIIARTR